MNLFLFPEAANCNNGYGFAVERDFLRLQPLKDDIIVWYTILKKDDMHYIRDNDIIIQKNKMLSPKSVYNIIFGKDRTELLAKELIFLRGKSFDKIFCGDTIFYNAIRELFPNTYLHVRFHNCFARICDRKNLLGRTLDWKYDRKLKSMYKTERKIFNDLNAYKIFISDEDRDYYVSMFGRNDDSESWLMEPDLFSMNKYRNDFRYEKKIVWFGGVESHKKASLEWFVNEVFPCILSKIPEVEFHLWGRGTDNYDNQSQHIYGHGFFDGDGVPLNNALYINPDIIGGGVKIKLLNLIEAGVPFISSYFGFEGYSHDLIDNKYIIVEEEDKWAERIIEILK